MSAKPSEGPKLLASSPLARSSSHAMRGESYLGQHVAYGCDPRNLSKPFMASERTARPSGSRGGTALFPSSLLPGLQIDLHYI